MGDMPLSVRRLRNYGPFPQRAVVAALRAFADALEAARDGRSVRVADIVDTVRKSEDNAKGLIYVLFILADLGELQPDRLRRLAQLYLDSAPTRRTPVRKVNYGAARTTSSSSAGEGLFDAPARQTKGKPRWFPA